MINILTQQTSRPLPSPSLVRLVITQGAREAAISLAAKQQATSHGRGKHPRGRQGRDGRRLPLRRLHASRRHPVDQLLLFLVGRRQPEGVHVGGGRLGHP